MTQQALRSMSLSSDDVLGRTEPRLWTPPLRELTPDTSYGFDVIDFARYVLRFPLDPWQEWLVIHAGELLPNGNPRFRKVLVIVARQNGKTTLPVVLSAYWMFVERLPQIFASSNKQVNANKALLKMIRLVEKTPSLNGRHDRRWLLKPPGGWEAWTKDQESTYTVGANNGDGGRSLTIDRAILDEIRQLRNQDHFDAVFPAMNAVAHAQAWMLTNAGDDLAVPLNEMREWAIEFIESKGERGDRRLGLFEWSSPEKSSPLDLSALAQANPNLGRRIDIDSFLGDAKRAVAKGGRALTIFKTNYMCLRVPMMDPAVDEDEWKACFVAGNTSRLKPHRAMFLDVSPDGQHATVCIAGKLKDSRIRVEVVKAYGPDPNAVNELRADLKSLLTAAKPQALGWLPGGPAAALGADLRPGLDGRSKLPGGLIPEEITGEATSVCMSFASMVTGGEVVHADDPLLKRHVTGSSKLFIGSDGAWRFTRKGGGHCDAAYAAAGAVYLAKLLKPEGGRLELVTA